MLRHLLALVAPPLCSACGADAARSAPLCRDCRADLARSSLAARPAVHAGVPVWSAFAYEGPAGALVRALKFRGRTGLAGVMAAQMAANAPPAVWDGALVPVPLHPRRLRRRGFNQAGLLAAALGRWTGLEVVDACLRRTGDAAPQSGRGRAQRIGGVAEAVVACGPVPQRALLVDDVVTTGATLAACARALRDAGCGEIGGITYARTRGR